MTSSLSRVKTESTSTRRTCDPSLRLRIASDDAVTLAEAFKALGHPVRLQIFDLINIIRTQQPVPSPTDWTQG